MKKSHNLEGLQQVQVQGNSKCQTSDVSRRGHRRAPRWEMEGDGAFSATHPDCSLVPVLTSVFTALI